MTLVPALCPLVAMPSLFLMTLDLFEPEGKESKVTLFFSSFPYLLALFVHLFIKQTG